MAPPLAGNVLELGMSLAKDEAARQVEIRDAERLIQNL
jgi:hypothetical protein